MCFYLLLKKCPKKKKEKMLKRVHTCLNDSKDV